MKDFYWSVEKSKRSKKQNIFTDFAIVCIGRHARAIPDVYSLQTQTKSGLVGLNPRDLALIQNGSCMSKDYFLPSGQYYSNSYL